MSSPDQSKDLERAIVERGRLLAQEHIHQGEQMRAETLKASGDKLRLLEENEILAAKVRAEREYRREVRAKEIGMQAALDGLRWAIVSEVLDRLRARLAQLGANEAEYQPVFSRLLARAAGAIERDELVASMNDADRRRFGGQWQELAARAAPGKSIVLSPESHACTGGVLVTTPNHRIRVDNTFEGLLERMEPELCRTIVERLFPTPIQMEMLFRG